MKLNTDEIAVKKNNKLVNCLRDIFKREDCPAFVLETGTFEGLGTTQVVLEAMIKADTYPYYFYTLEPHSFFFEVAKENLKENGFIRIIKGISVTLKEALEFVEKDPMLLDHESYPDIICDGYPPVDYYKFEINAPFFENPHPPEQDMLRKLIPGHEEDNPLFVLDSCGGLGLLEFTRVQEIMGNNHYYLMVDDSGSHIKHIRTREYIEKADFWNILYYDKRVLVAERIAR